LPIWIPTDFSNRPVPRALILTSCPATSARSAPTVHCALLRCWNGSNEYHRAAHNEDIYRAFRPDLENPTREDAEAAFPAMQAMPIPYIEPGDVSELVAFLASDRARYMTGLNIRIDAGAMLKGGMSF
jgi:hypothetical protein